MARFGCFSFGQSPPPPAVMMSDRPTAHRPKLVEGDGIREQGSGSAIQSTLSVLVPLDKRPTVLPANLLSSVEDPALDLHEPGAGITRYSTYTVSGYPIFSSFIARGKNNNSQAMSRALVGSQWSKICRWLLNASNASRRQPQTS